MIFPPSNRLRALLAAIVLASSLPATAFAAPSASDIATARVLVAEGRKLRAAGNFPGAIEKLKAAYALYPTPVTGHELALAYKDAKRLVEAREAAIAVAGMPVEADEGKASADARADCSALITELGKRVAEVTLFVDGYPQGATVTVTLDGNAVPMAALSEPRVLDPGAHVVVATMPAAPEAKVEFTVGEGEHRKVDVHLKTSETPILGPTTTSTETPSSFAAPPPSATTATTTTTEGTKSGTGWLTYVGFGVAGVGAVVGTITGLQAISAGHRLSDHCDGNHVCPASEDADVKKLNTTSTISTVSFALAGVGLVAAIVDMTTHLTAEPTPEPKTGAASVHVSLGPGSIAIGGAF